MRVAERRAVNSFRERAPSFAAIAIAASVTARLEVSKLRGKSSLEVHHMEFRGQGGDDAEENLITLCAGCHSRMHLILRVSPKFLLALSL